MVVVPAANASIRPDFRIFFVSIVSALPTTLSLDLVLLSNASGRKLDSASSQPGGHLSGARELHSKYGYTALSERVPTQHFLLVAAAQPFLTLGQHYVISKHYSAPRSLKRVLKWSS